MDGYVFSVTCFLSQNKASIRDYVVYQGGTSFYRTSESQLLTMGWVRADVVLLTGVI
jgi:hypothetical protein